VAGNKNLVDVRTTAGTKKDIKQLQKDLEAAANSINMLVKGYQNLATVKMAQSTKAAAGNALGLGSFNSGVGYRERQRAADTAKLGTATGQVADQQKRLVQELNKEQRTREGIAKIQQASKLDAVRALKDVQKMTQAQDVLGTKELARLKNAQARNQLETDMARRDVRRVALRGGGLDADQKNQLLTERNALTKSIATGRQTVRQSEKLEQAADRQLASIQRATEAKAEQVRFDKESARLQNQSLSARRNANRERIQGAQAESLNLQKSLRSVGQIKDIGALRAVQERALTRLGLEQGRGNIEAVRQAQKLNSLIEQRLRMRKQEIAAEKARPKGMTAEQIAVGRDNKRRGLLGDSGASLFVIQAGLMANYALMNQLQTGVQAAIGFTVNLDTAMRNLQAIVRITDTDLGVLKDSLIGISEETKFTAVEVANAAVTLGQAGFSTTEIQDSIRAVSLLATATGTELDRAVDIATSTIGVFNMESSQMAEVANVLTEAVNTSKLNIEKLTLGLQYSGNIAAQSGVSFKELTSALGAMANAGIRSGSTLGTGMRQILIALQKPSKEFSETLDRLGLTMDDVNLETKGLYGALKNLKDAGFSSADAIKAFEVRAASAYNALSGNLEQMLSLQNAFQRTSAAIRANETQMRSLSNQGKRLGSVLGSVAAAGLDPLLKLVTAVTKALADGFAVIRKYEGALQTVVTVLASGAVVAAAVYFGRMAMALKNLMFVAPAAAAAMTGVGVASRGAAAGVLALNLGLRMTPIGIAIGAVSLLAGGFQLLSGVSYGTAKALEKAQTAFDRSTGAAEATGKSIIRVDATLQDLLNRFDLLSGGGAILESAILDVQRQFVEMGKDADSVGTTVVDLIKTMRDLRKELSQKFVLEMDTSIRDLDTLIKSTQDTLSQGLKANKKTVMEVPYDLRRDNSASQYQSTQLKNIQNLAVPLAIPGASANQVGSSTSQLNALLLDFETNARDKTGINHRVQGVLAEYIKSILDGSADTFTQLQDLERYIQQKQEQIRVREAAVERSNPAVATLIDDASELDTDVAARIGGNISGTTANARFKEVSQRFANFDRDSDQQRQTLQMLIDAGIITSQENIDLITQMINEAESTALNIFRGFKEEADTVNEKIAGEDVKAAKKKLEELGKELSEAKGFTAIANALTAQLDQLEVVRDLELKAIAAAGGDADLQAAQALGVNADYDAQGADIQDKTTDRVTDVIDAVAAETAELEKQIELEEVKLKYEADSRELAQAKLDIEKEHVRVAMEAAGLGALVEDQLAQMQKLLDLKFKNRAKEDTKEAEEKLAVMKAQNKVAFLTKILGEDNLQVVKARNEAEYDAYKLIVDSSEASADLKEELLAAFREGQKISDLNLAGPIERAVSAASRLAGKLARAGSLMRTFQGQKARAEIREEFAGDEVGAAGALTQLEQEESRGGAPATWFDTFVDGFVVYGARAAARAEKDAAAAEKAAKPGRGGRKHKKRDPEFEKMLASIKNDIGSATIDIDNGGDERQGLETILSALQDANAELEKRRGLIDQISAKTTRTVAEEERLTALLDQHGKLTSFIKQEEENILWLKEKQGMAQIDLSKVIKDWSKESLSVVKTVEEGTKDVLNNLLTGFGTLFTDLVSGTKSGKDAFRDFAASVVQSLMQVFARMLAIKALEATMSIFGKGSAAGGFISDMLDGLKGSREGGMVRKAGGGPVEGNLARDSQPHLLMPGEYVLRASAARMIGREELDRLNSMGNTKRKAAGGIVGAAKPKGPGQNQNLWLVDERSRAPVPGPNDMIAIISDDIAKNGSTGQLIRAISGGSM